MSTASTDKKLFSIKETAAILGVSERSVWAITARKNNPQGKLVSCRIGCRVLYSQESIDRFIKQSEGEGVDER